MYSNNYYKSIVIMGGLGAQPPGAEITYIFMGLTLEMDKKLGIIIKNKGLFRNLAHFECFYRNFREA